MFNKSTRLSISAMSALAEVHGTDSPTMTASQIAKRRGIPSPFVAKLMTTLSMRGLVNGTRGPGGGYSLARPPSAISLLEIATSFQRMEEPECPLGRSHVCSNSNACALHRPLHELQDAFRRFLSDTTLKGFKTAALPQVAARKASRGGRSPSSRSAA